MAQRGLNRNKRLDLLLSPKQTLSADNSQPKDLQLLPIEQLQRGRYQPRRDIETDTLQELADSIKAQGVIQPIIVRQLNAREFEIIAGERRWRAAQLAGLSEVPTLVRDINDETAMAMALIENIQREDLNPLEEANALQRLIDEFQMTQQDVATVVGKSRTAVTNLLRLLKLNPDVKRLLEYGDLEMGHARALLSVTGHAQTKVAQQVVSQALSVRETEQLVRRLLNPPTKVQPMNSDINTRHLQDNLSEKLGAKVTLKSLRDGKGKLIICYNNIDELDGILEHFN